MKPTIQRLLALQKEYDLLADLEENLQKHITIISDMDMGTEFADQLEALRKQTLDKMSDMNWEAHQMARYLRLHRPSKN